MDFEDVNSSVDNPKLAQMYENLTSLTKQLAVLQGFIESKFGSEFTKFCQLSGRNSSIDHQNYSPGVHDSVDQEDGDYDKMPNLVSQESPSRTLGYVTVPLRQTGGTIPTPKLYPAPGSNSNSGQGKRDRSVLKDGSLQNVTENDDIMYPLHILPDLLVENNEEMDTSETPEFLELELDPTVLLRGEPPALPMFADASEDGSQNSIDGSPLIQTKRTSISISNQSGSTSRFELEESSRGNNNVSRRASVGGHEGHLSRKKFDCLVCGIKFEFAETLKSHMDSHAGIRNIRSNSEDQQGVGNNANAPPLPKLMPRPSIPPPSDLSPVSLKIESPGSGSDDLKSKPSRTKKIAPIPSSSSTSGSSKLASALKRRKRYNQTRPSSLECPECGLKIRDKSRLIEHLRGHTGERPFQCEICDKSYTRRDVLKTHILKMHGEVAQYHAS